MYSYRQSYRASYLRKDDYGRLSVVYRTTGEHVYDPFKRMAPYTRHLITSHRLLELGGHVESE